MKSEFDVIIAGSGPAGAVCGYFLAKEGFRVAILEKDAHPREKYCAGGVPGSVFDIVPVEKNQKYIHIDKYCFTYMGEKPSTGEIKGGEVYSLDRSVFDHSLAKLARDTGAFLFENCKVVSARETEGRVSVQCSDDRTLYCEVLVGAEGGTSVISRNFDFFPQNFKKRDTGICGYYEFYPDERTRRLYESTVHLDFNFVRGGVAGILPKTNHLWIGVYKGERSTLQEMEKIAGDFIKKLKLVGAVGKFKGLLIPLYRRPAKLNRQRVVLAGEAARLVNPLSGEGIKPAMDSGRLAAESISDYLKKGFSLDQYSEKIRSQLGEEFLVASSFSRIAYTFPNLTYDGMIRVSEDAVKILNGTLSYKNFQNRLKRKIMKKIGLGGKGV